MLNKTRLRFYFASLRVSRGFTDNEIKLKIGKIKRLMINITKIIPSNLSAIRTGFYFIILRPFDILPTFFFRILGSMVVRFNISIQGKTPYKR